jgi:putative ABC transport system ATP-binding protein
MSTVAMAPDSVRAIVPDLADGDRPREAAYRLRDVIRIHREADRETIALRGIDLDIDRAGLLVVMGRSGSGKSSLLALLAGADRPTGGQVFYGDTDLGRAPESTLQRLRGREIGLLFQRDNLVPFLSVSENLRLAAALASNPIEADTEIGLLERVGLGDRAGHRPGQLSGGEQQRAALACVLAAASRVVLMDEPTAELDSHTAARVLELVRDVQREHLLTVVVATHDPAVAAHADRVVTLSSGRISDDRRA